MQERTLFLHIGHDKTGSTSLQTAFTASRATLRDHGIDYPVTGDDARVVNLDTMVPVGNARQLAESPQALARALAALPRSERHCLLSSELIFGMLAREQDYSFIGNAARTAGFSGVCILLFIRDPLPHAVSVWQQRVKGWQGETVPLDEWLASRYDTPEQVYHVVSTMSTNSDVRLTVRHYDRHRHRLVDEVETWLGLPEGTLLRPAHAVNRSLTAGEAALQRALNARIGPSGRIFAFRLVNRLPDLPREPAKPTAAAQNRALERLRPVLDAANAILPAGQHYGTDPIAACEEGEVYRFNEAQLEIIAEGIADVLGSKPEENVMTSVKRRLLGRLRLSRRR